MLGGTKSATPGMWTKTLTGLHDYRGVHPQKTQRQAASFLALRFKSRVPMPSGAWADAKQNVGGCQVNCVPMPSHAGGAQYTWQRILGLHPKTEASAASASAQH